MAFETYALYPPLRVRENIAFGLLRDRAPTAEIEKQVKTIAAMLEITDLLERFPPSISGGAQQRVSLARALIRNAAVHLLDEPMSQLEPQLRALLRARIKDYLIAQKMTTVVVTHDQTEAIALADRIAVMEKGVLQQFATPHDLQDRPANLFVASFIGEPPMNLFPAVVQDGKVGGAERTQGSSLSDAAGRFGGGRQIRRRQANHGRRSAAQDSPRAERASGGHKPGGRSDLEPLARRPIASRLPSARLSHDRGRAGATRTRPSGRRFRWSISSEAVRIFDADSGAAIDQGPDTAASLVA